MNGYQIKKLKPELLDDLRFIFEDAFGKKVTGDFLRKKQDTSVFGPSFTGFIAYSDQGEPAAFYGVFPCMADYKGRKYLVAQSGDTMTHSRHTGKGLFTALANKTYEYCRENGIHLVFGFPNENSYPGFTKKLGWSHFDDLHAYLIRVYCLPWVRLKKWLGLSEAQHQAWGQGILARFPKGQPFESSCKDPDVPVVDHSREFFQYKSYGQNYLLRLSGVDVWLKFSETFLIIGDIRRCSDAEFRSVLSGLRKIAFLLGTPHLRMHCSSGTWAEKQLRQYGIKTEISYPVGGINFSNEMPLQFMKFTTADNDTF